MNNTRNVWIGIVIVALIVGAYYFGTASKNEIQPATNTDVSNNSLNSGSQDTTSAPTTNQNVASDNNLQTKRKECLSMFDAFKLKVLNDNEASQSQQKNYFSISANNFIVGYSSRLNSCIGAYTYRLLSSGSGATSVSYFIVDPKTNLLLKNWPEYNSIMMTYANYRKTLNDITDGQISINDNSIKEDQTPGLMFCNVSYFKCPIGDKPMCNSNQPSSSGWCASQ